MPNRETWVKTPNKITPHIVKRKLQESAIRNSKNQFKFHATNFSKLNIQKFIVQIFQIYFKKKKLLSTTKDDKFENFLNSERKLFLIFYKSLQKGKFRIVLVLRNEMQFGNI